MDASQDKAKATQKLVNNLEELVKLYRSLLECVRKEKDLLIQADIEKINENNLTKEALIHKIRSQDSARERYAKELCSLIGADVSNPRLLEIAKKISGPEADRFRNLHATLDLVVNRVAEINKENAQYAQSALKALNGAMDNIKDTLSPKKTYARQGTMERGGDASSGNFVSKEA